MGADAAGSFDGLPVDSVGGRVGRSSMGSVREGSADGLSVVGSGVAELVGVVVGAGVSVAPVGSLVGGLVVFSVGRGEGSSVRLDTGLKVGSLEGVFLTSSTRVGVFELSGVGRSEFSVGGAGGACSGADEKGFETVGTGESALGGHL